MGTSKNNSSKAGANKVNKQTVNNSNLKKEENEKVLAGGREMQVSDTPLTTLIKAAASINPKQFSLPYEMTLPCNFPGEPKCKLYLINIIGDKSAKTLMAWFS